MMQTLALGIDIGGTNTAYGIVNRSGEIVKKGSMPTVGHATVQDYIAAMTAEIMPLVQEYGLQNFVGIGVGAPNGNYYTGEIAFAPNLPWKGVIPLAKLMSESFHMKATLTNDANAAAIGEMTYGVAKGMKDFIVVTLGTGVGSGFVANGQMVYGHDGFAGELGHVIVDPVGRICGCGRKGCLETYVSATGIVRTAEAFLDSSKKASLLRDRQNEITAKAIYESAEAGDELALEIFDYTSQILGMALANAVAITSPEAIILFGGLAKAGDILLRATRKYMEDYMLNIYKNKVALLTSYLPDADAAILGASALAW